MRAFIKGRDRRSSLKWPASLGVGGEGDFGLVVAAIGQFAEDRFLAVFLVRAGHHIGV